MGERSVFANAMRFLLVAAVVFATVMIVKAVDGLKTAVEGIRIVAGPAPREKGDAKLANAELYDPAAESGDEMIMTFTSDTKNMNYIVNNESQVSSYWDLCYDSLAQRNYNTPDVFEPLLAERWEVSDDKLTFTIHLRKGVLWHDFTDPTTGESFENVEVKAGDFAFYIDVIRNEKIACDPIRSYWKDLDRIEVIDDHTFKVIWKKKYFLSVSMTIGLSPLPRHFYRFDPEKADKEFDENTKRNSMIVGCGQWRFEKWEKDKACVFRRNEKYYGNKPALERLRFRMIKEPNARLTALRKHEVDRIGLLPEQWLDQTNDEPFERDFAKFKYLSRSYSYIGWNMRRDLFKDRRVRLAMTHLVNRARIRAEVYRDLAEITTGNFWIASKSYDTSIKPWAFDLERAKALLAEAGWKDTDDDGVLDKDGKPLRFTLATISNHPIQERLAPIVKEDMAKAGVVMEITPFEWSVYLDKLNKHDFDACTLGWALGYEGDPYQLWHSSEADKEDTSNHCGFKNARADEIIETARREFDVEKRTALYHEFHKILHEEQPYTFLFSSKSLVTQDRRYRNAKVYPIESMHIRSMWVPAAEQRR